MPQKDESHEEYSEQWSEQYLQMASQLGRMQEQQAARLGANGGRGGASTFARCERQRSQGMHEIRRRRAAQRGLGRCWPLGSAGAVSPGNVYRRSISWVARHRVEVRGEGRPEFRSEIGARGSDVGDSP